MYSITFHSKCQQSEKWKNEKKHFKISKLKNLKNFLEGFLEAHSSYKLKTYIGFGHRTLSFNYLTLWLCSQFYIIRREKLPCNV